MSQTKGIQARIKSVTNTKKVTKAMEMVAAAKMRKAIEAVLKTRTYAILSWETILRLSGALNNNHKFLAQKKEKPKSQNKIAIILFTSNRGLCGGFNTNIVNKLYKTIKNKHNTQNIELILFGKKGIKAYNYYKYNIVAEFNKPDIASGINDVIPVAKLVCDEFLNNKYSKIILAYTDFVSASKQEAKIKQILPVEINAKESELVNIHSHYEKNSIIDESKKKDLNSVKEYLFEPDAKTVLDELIPRLIEIQIFQALLESNASEHSARMSAMHQATDAARDMIEELTLTYNKIRQAGITAEIAEIGAGVNAMK